MFNSEIATPEPLDSIIWLEQTAPGEYSRHSLQTGTCNFATIDLADFDDDGDLDLAVGNYIRRTSQTRTDEWALLFENKGSGVGSRGSGKTKN